MYDFDDENDSGHEKVPAETDVGFPRFLIIIAVVDLAGAVEIWET